MSQRHSPSHHRLTSARRVAAQNWHAAQRSTLTPGERAADRMRNSMGSWGFVGSFVAFMGVWAVINSLTAGWDPYPFILLNLFLSMLAGLQGAILLIAAKRQDAISATLAQHDYNTNIAAKTDVESLLELVHEQRFLITELRDELCLRLDTLGEGVQR